MKNTIFILAIVFIPLFISCSNSNGNKFIGTWKNKSGDKVTIIKDGDVYILKGGDVGNFSFKLKDGSLKGDNGEIMGIKIGDINYLESSGHITIGGDEFEKSSDK